jgi:hypothetical protein
VQATPSITKYYLSREDTLKMPIIKFVVFLALIDNTKTQSLFFKAPNIFATCCNDSVGAISYLGQSKNTLNTTLKKRAALKK